MHVSTVRVRYADTDRMGIAYNANYIIWFEVGRTEYMRDIKIPYRYFEEKGVFMLVVENYCHYITPARYDDLLYINTKIAELKYASIKFQYIIKRDEEVIAEGYAKLAFADSNMKPINLKKHCGELWEKLMEYCEG